MVLRVTTQQRSPIRTNLPRAKTALTSPRSRAPASQLQNAIGNSATTRLLRANYIQPKLTVSDPGDASEREADRIADQVMRMPAPQSKTTSSVESLHPASLLQRKCAACEAEQEPEQEGAVQRKQIAESGKLEAEGHINLRGGAPLPQSARTFFEPRFNYDFGAVRLHTDPYSAAKSQEYNARAFTIGRDIAFAAGEYTPNTHSGQQLLAHELAHVVQQGGTARSRGAGLSVDQDTDEQMIQRACGPRPIESALKSSGAPSCTGLSGDVSDVTIRRLFRFRINCDEFASPAEKKKFDDFLKSIRPGDFFKVHGFASVDGDPGFNADLSCARAVKVAQMIMKAGAIVTDVFSFGPTDGPAADRRSVVVTPTMIPGEAPRVCPGPFKTVDVSIFILPGATRNIFADLAFANRVVSSCCVGIKSVKGASLGVKGWKDTILRHSDNCTDVSAQEEEMFQEARRSGGGASIWIFYVDQYDPDTTGSKGISCRTANMSGKRSLFPQGAYIKNRADPSTLAHELGHILIASGKHEGIVDPNDPANLMQVQDPRGQRVDLDTEQCKRISNNA